MPGSVAPVAEKLSDPLNGLMMSNSVSSSGPNCSAVRARAAVSPARLHPSHVSLLGGPSVSEAEATLDLSGCAASPQLPLSPLNHLGVAHAFYLCLSLGSLSGCSSWVSAFSEHSWCCDRYLSSIVSVALCLVLISNHCVLGNLGSGSDLSLARLEPERLSEENSSSMPEPDTPTVTDLSSHSSGTPVLCRSARKKTVADAPVASPPVTVPLVTQAPRVSRRSRRTADTRNRDILRRVHEAFVQERLAREAEALQDAGPSSSALAAHVIANLDGIQLDDPSTYEALAAMRCPFSAQWRAAMADEMESLLVNNTWEEARLVPSGSGKPIGSKWVFKVKHNSDGTARFKARLVIKGYEQRKGRDFDQTYAPVSRLSTLRLLLGLASERKWRIDHLDVVTAFLNPAIDNYHVYMTLPEGMADLPSRLSGMLVRLLKALYGLRQAPRLWYQMIDAFLLSIGFRKSDIEPSLYIQSDILLLLYVDDMLVAYKDSSKAREIKDLLQKEYKMQDLGEARRFLGLDIRRHCDGSYSINQTRYVDSILRRFGMEKAKTAPTPLHKDTMLDQFQHDQSVDQGEYLRMVGSLMYAALGTRPDIAYAVAALSAYNHNPWMVHLTAAKRVLRYLKGSKGLGLRFSATTEQESGPLLGYSDADWSNNLRDRHSIGAYVFFYGGGLVSWKSRKQSILATSTLESEYTALFESGKEALWLRQLLHDITNVRSSISSYLTEIARLYLYALEEKLPEGSDELLEISGPAPLTDYTPTLPSATTIYTDSQRAIENICSEGVSAQNKHFDIRLFKSRELQRAGIVTFIFRGTDENAADGLTKVLTQSRHEIFLKQLGLVSCEDG